MIDRRTFTTLLAGTVAAPNMSWGQAAKGKTVPDLVSYMKNKGLSFAPAVAGQEPAYAALHQALAAYDLAAQNQVAAQEK